MKYIKTIILQILGLLIFQVISICGLIAQSEVQPAQDTKQNNFSIGLNVGYDLPSYENVFKYYKVDPGLKYGLTLNYDFGILGIGLDYDFLSNKSASSLNDIIFYDATFSTSANKIDLTENISRHFIGIGPNFNFSISPKLDFKVSLRGGYSLLKGGELITTSTNPILPTATDYHVLFSGIDDGVWAAKAGLGLKFHVSPKIAIGLGGYYMHHFGVHPEGVFQNISTANPALIYGHSHIETVGANQVLGTEPAFSVMETNVEEPACSDYTSVGGQLSLVFTFGGPKKEKIKKQKIVKEEKCKNCECPDDTHKVVVTVKDQQTGKIIPNADVAIKDGLGNIIATGTTNSYGAVDFGTIPHGNYTVSGNVYGVETAQASLVDAEFLPDAVIQKTVFYTDLRFILKGTVINLNTNNIEPNVTVNLTNTATGAVKQTTSDSNGKFAFRLDKSSSYEIVGVKQNRLSNVTRSSTHGLNRSTTLFVDLQLGVENFECNRGTILDIKYAFDKDVLEPESKYALDKLVRYLMAHPSSSVELSSHTDSRGSAAYNQDLSQRRAQSAVSYIVGRGVSRSRITAIGYGETRLRNRCSDDVKCSEEEHQTNRRTEAKLICN